MTPFRKTMFVLTSRFDSLISGLVCVDRVATRKERVPGGLAAAFLIARFGGQSMKYRATRKELDWNGEVNMRRIYQDQKLYCG